MNLYLMLAIVIANAIAIGIVYQFIKNLANKQKLIIIAISIATMYILISITYWISGFGIDEKIHEASKNFITYLFVPVNIILFAPYVAAQYIKLKLKQIKEENFVKKIILVIILLLIVLVVEGSYFRYMQNNINLIGNNIEQNNTNQIQNENIVANEQVTNQVSINEIEQNIISNEIIGNEID